MPIIPILWYNNSIELFCKNNHRIIINFTTQSTLAKRLSSSTVTKNGSWTYPTPCNRYMKRRYPCSDVIFIGHHACFIVYTIPLLGRFVMTQGVSTQTNNEQSTILPDLVGRVSSHLFHLLQILCSMKLMKYCSPHLHSQKK